MIIMNSNLLLEHLTELEKKIESMENLMREKQIEFDRDKLMELLVACQFKTNRHDQNS
jgi:hypothetical protein